MSDWGDEVIRHKYDPLPDEPRHRKKAKKRHVRSDHRHVYEDVCVRVRFRKGCLYYVGTRCKACGRIGNMTMRQNEREPEAGLPLYEVVDMATWWKTKSLWEELMVR